MTPKCLAAPRPQPAIQVNLLVIIITKYKNTFRNWSIGNLRESSSNTPLMSEHCGAHAAQKLTAVIRLLSLTMAWNCASSATSTTFDLIDIFVIEKKLLLENMLRQPRDGAGPGHEADSLFAVTAIADMREREKKMRWDPTLSCLPSLYLFLTNSLLLGLTLKPKNKTCGSWLGKPVGDGSASFNELSFCIMNKRALSGSVGGCRLSSQGKVLCSFVHLKTVWIGMLAKIIDERGCQFYAGNYIKA